MNRYFFIAASYFFALPGGVFGAQIVLEPQEQVVGMETPFAIAVNLSSEEFVNALSIAIHFPRGIDPVETSDGNSVISPWLDEPHFDETTRILSFSGLMPGGFSGDGARILIIYAQASEEGRFEIAVDKTVSEIYRNAPGAEAVSIAAEALALEVRKGKHNTMYRPADTLPPEPFVPEVVATPDESARWVVVFSAQDKISGVARYEVRERHAIFPWLVRVSRDARSPYELRDQTLSSHVEIRAYDAAGNVRMSTVPPANRIVRLVDIFAPLALGAAILMILMRLVGLNRRI